ncbi:class D sortase [Bacillus sp. DJP31]|uniref:class D sortase n=1 Tax=Bacillus sp. DJP31 TaxID=3409789 RepID=UPI003BB797BD
MVIILHNGFWFWKGNTLTEEVANKSETEQVQSVSVQSPTFVVGDHIGMLSISALEMKLPIFHGTSKNELKKGVGHYVKSAVPGENRHTVLAGHRDTLFRELEDIHVGDEILVETNRGDFLYTVLKTRIVDKDDRTVLVEKPSETLSLVTCYPFRYVGDAPERFIVSARLVE